MKILIDAQGVRQLKRIDQQPVGREMRYYYVPRTSTPLFHLVCRCGLLEDLAGRVCDAAVGWGVGWHGKCRPEHEGLQLRKVTVFRLLDDGAGSDTTLSALIAESKKLPRRRPPRGARWAKPYGFDEG